MADALTRVAERALILAYADIEAQLREGSGPLLEIWKRWRQNAVESLHELVLLNVYNPQDRIKIVTHQNEIKRYVEYANALRDIHIEGCQTEKRLTAEDRLDLVELIKGMPAEERAMIDLGPEGNEERDAPMD